MFHCSKIPTMNRLTSSTVHPLNCSNVKLFYRSTVQQFKSSTIPTFTSFNYFSFQQGQPFQPLTASTVSSFICSTVKLFYRSTFWAPSTVFLPNRSTVLLFHRSTVPPFDWFNPLNSLSSVAYHCATDPSLNCFKDRQVQPLQLFTSLTVQLFHRSTVPQTKPFERWNSWTVEHLKRWTVDGVELVKLLRC